MVSKVRYNTVVGDICDGQQSMVYNTVVGDICDAQQSTVYNTAVGDICDWPVNVWLVSGPEAAVQLAVQPKIYPNSIL